MFRKIVLLLFSKSINIGEKSNISVSFPPAPDSCSSWKADCITKHRNCLYLELDSKSWRGHLKEMLMAVGYAFFKAKTFWCSLSKYTFICIFGILVGYLKYQREGA